MIRVTVELLSAREPGKVEHLGTAIIVNDGVKSVRTKGRLGDYLVRLSRRGAPESAWRRAVVTDFPRQRLNAWVLVFRALQAALAHEPGRFPRSSAGEHLPGRQEVPGSNPGGGCAQAPSYEAMP